MITTLIAAMVAMPAADLSCAVMGSPVTDITKSALDYAGVRYVFCCAGCDSAFEKEPVKYSAVKAGKTTGYFLFDPVSGSRLDFSEKSKTAKVGPVDYKGVRFYFANEADMAAFNKAPAKYNVMPTKEVLSCAVSGEAIASPADAGGYSDVAGVRYYVCCGDCLPQLKSKGPDAKAKAAAKAIVVHKVK